ncbi:MAG: 30S ribosomal protein S8 [Dehalococcoidia bacterium]|jgi:small subunit ribosomal protein S8|nr:30S ribosomal protein S8 [Dehalococcoidia bacterium]
MSMSDPIADMFTRIRNAVRAEHADVLIPKSRTKQAIADVLRGEGFITEVEEVAEESRSYLRLKLSYGDDRKALLSNIKRISRPGLRIYVGNGEIPRVYGGLGISILSTSKGVMSGKDAWRAKIGGEVLCYVW